MRLHFTDLQKDNNFVHIEETLVSRVECNLKLNPNMISKYYILF